jgi:hypothetical protein
MRPVQRREASKPRQMPFGVVLSSQTLLPKYIRNPSSNHLPIAVLP